MSRSVGQAPRQKATAGEVTDFLSQFIETMDRTGGVNLWPTSKNRAFEDATGFTQRDAEDVARHLTYKNYSQGPEDDDIPTRSHGKVWVFQTEYFGEPIYLKLKLVGAAGSHTEAACLSFHEPEREMKTPLKVNQRRTAPQTKRPGGHGR